MGSPDDTPVHTMNLFFPASLDEVEKVFERARGFLDRDSIRERLFAIMLVLSEALTNAIIHGSRGDISKEVRLGLEIYKDRLVMEIEDQGQGFDYNRIFARGLPDTGESGRGLFIMKAYLDEVRYNAKGNAVRLVMRLYDRGE
ncbi:MAG: ATP-binding protein [Thermodesulfobacteriota bacterium]|nr:ATP-binding protein [Thermodesulfobacteriota bacterium]